MVTLGCTGGEDVVDAGGMDAATGGTAAKGEACTTSADCAEPMAICRKGNLCTGTLDELSFQTECAQGGAADCPGLTCVGLRDNMQGKTGICSMACDADEECGAGAACIAFTATSKGCLTVCTSSADCMNGYACVADPEGRGMACFVEPL